ncbi:sensory rhodopsin transducer [Leucobacter sp. CSA1]|uniref:Sensory rhodopsin transducer n=1 Tax=Leucobacter chromiisoli TaxID=2796471 RepID=A0A934Q715_9MICO|nr:sensory rhodopsin transducer [Leucobacter chromiisoli]MBK0418017.1 sensory rhodopsin transducer [Leucobacter chromiisoli]
MEHSVLGHTRWTFSAGWIPAQSTGREPEYTSRNVLCVLNTSSGDACVRVTVYHEDRDPISPYEILVPASRVRHVRINDLIDPEAVPLGRPYGLVLISDAPIVAQLVYVDTRKNNLAVAMISGVPDVGRRSS